MNYILLFTRNLQNIYTGVGELVCGYYRVMELGRRWAIGMVRSLGRVRQNYGFVLTTDSVMVVSFYFVLL